MAEVGEYWNKHKTFEGFPNAEIVEITEPNLILEKKCDVLAICSKEQIISKGNADKLNCQILVEGSNGAITFAADELLQNKGVLVIPDIVINTGGVIVSYFEWLKNLDHISPGRLTKKYQQKSSVTFMEELGYKIPKESPMMKKLEGGSEVDIVLSSLEDVL